MKLLNIVCLFLACNNFCYSQDKDSGKIYTSEIVFLIDPNLKSTIRGIMKKDGFCQTKSVQWSIEFIKDDMILITKYNLENFLASKGIKNIYTTIIDDNFLFVFIKENIEEFFTKSGYSVNLSSFIDKENFSTIDYSFWVIKKNERKKYKIIKEKNYMCDN